MTSPRPSATAAQSGPAPSQRPAESGSGESLIARLKTATEGSRELDFEIFKLLHPMYAKWEYRGFNSGGEYIKGPGRFREQCPSDPYTTSIEAALTLVPDGWAWHRMKRVGRDRSIWMAILLPEPRNNLPDAHGNAATPALALCIAALKARAAPDGANPTERNDGKDQ